MDLDIADTAPSASTSTAVAIQQQEGTHGNEPAIEILKASSSQKAGPLLFPFESEGDSSFEAAANGIDRICRRYSIS